MEKRKPIFMIHKHHATHLHYDLRLEIQGKLASWALRSIDFRPNKPILAIKVPDHPFWYRHFEGVIPEGQYGAGPVMVWDKGLYTSFLKNHNNQIISIEESVQNGFMTIWLEGHKLKGGYILIRISKKQRWLLIKMEDEYVNYKKNLNNWNKSVKSGKSLNEILKHYLKKQKLKRG